MFGIKTLLLLISLDLNWSYIGKFDKLVSNSRCFLSRIEYNSFESCNVALELADSNEVVIKKNWFNSNCKVPISNYGNYTSNNSYMLAIEENNFNYGTDTLSILLGGSSCIFKKLL